MNNIENIITLLKCIECGDQNLDFSNNKLTCNNCRRDYPIDDNILNMMPLCLLKAKENEIKIRNNDAQTYDLNRPDDYVLLIDYHCLENNKDKFNSDSIVLDLACGTGRSSIMLSKYVKTVISIDFSFESLKILRDKIERENIHNIIIIQADANNLPFTVKNFFDFINCEEVIQHIPTFCLREALLSDLYILLKKNGYLTLTTYYYSKKKRKDTFVQIERSGERGKQGYHKGKIYYYNFDLPELYVLCQECDFTVVDYKLFYLDFPLWARTLQKTFKIKRFELENILSSFYKDNANRIYMLVKK